MIPPSSPVYFLVFLLAIMLATLSASALFASALASCRAVMGLPLAPLTGTVRGTGLEDSFFTSFFLGVVSAAAAEEEEEEEDLLVWAFYTEISNKQIDRDK